MKLDSELSLEYVFCSTHAHNWATRQELFDHVHSVHAPGTPSGWEKLIHCSKGVKVQFENLSYGRKFRSKKPIGA